MFSFFELLDDLVTECRKVVRCSAGDEALIADHFLINPYAACVFNIFADSRKRGHGPSLKDVGFYQQPRSVTDDAHRFALLEERLHESDHVLVGPELVRTDTTAGNDKAVEFLSGNLRNHIVHLVAAASIEVVVICLGLAGLDTDYGHHRTSRLNGVLRLLEFGLLAVR